MNSDLFDEKCLNFSKEKISLRSLPVNFNTEDISLFKHELEKKIPAVNICKYEDVKISAEGIIFYKNRILIESFAFPENFRKWKKRAIVKTYINNFLLRKRNYINKNVFWVTDDWSKGYFHWLCDVLPRLKVISGYFENAVLLLPDSFRSLDYVQTSLEIFGIKDIRYINNNEILLCSKLYLPTHTAASGDFNEPIIKEVQKTFWEKSDSGKNVDFQKVYISRRKADKRKIQNEDEILEILKKYDFKIICAEDYSFIEQVQLFASVKYLVSSHGAGMTNMLFMPECGNIFELRKFDDNINNCYFNMASALGLKFYYQLCRSDNMEEDAHTANIIVDKIMLCKNLERLLK